MTEHPELEQLFGTIEAALMLGVKPSTIRQWKRRGHLAPTGSTKNGHNLYRGIDLLRAQAATRRKTA